MTTLRAPRRAPLLQVLKTSAAAILAWLLSTLLLDQPLPIFAAIAALLVVQPSVNQSLTKGIERSVGVIAGVVIAFGLGAVIGRDAWAILLVIVLSLLIAWALRLGPGSTNQIPISGMLMLALGGTAAYAADRILETIIGAVTGLLVNLAIVPPVLLAPANLALGRLIRDVAASLDRLAVALREPQSPAQLDEMLTAARALRTLREDAAAAIAQGADSLTLNPRSGKLRKVLEHNTLLFDRVSILVTRVLGMARAVHDRWDETLSSEPTVAAIATELERAAHDLRLVRPEGVKRKPKAEPVPVTAELPALTAPLSVMRPHPEHWILIGSLLEDIRRVREEIIGSES